ncbi:MAG TPA: hypothetical protein VKA30_11690, partial [Actinomycetota bacterium]|nr:hypothetical protein [Actinomycetota bacterium]
MTARGRARAVTVLLVVATLGLSAHAAPAATSTFATGDVFAGVGSNHVLWRLSDGSANKTLTTATSSSITTGMGFDGSGELYVTGYTSNIINRFKTNGSTDTTFGGSFGAHPESISFDRAGNVYVGQATGARSLLKYNAAGTQVASYAASPEGSHGTDRIDLANDQCTVYYTSQGKSVRSFNVCTNTQGPNVTSSLPGKTATDVKILPGGDLLVADTASILRLSPSGSIVKTFDQPSRDCWSTLALGPSATSFWAGDKCASRVYQFDTSSGSLVRSFATGTKTGTVNGLGVSGGYTAGQAPPPPPPSADVSVSLSDSADPVVGSQSYDYVATVSNGGPDAASGVSLSVSVSDNDPNSNASVTDATGTGWTCSTTSTVASCSLSGSLGSGSAAAAVHVTVQAPGATSTGTVTGSASAAASQTDPNTNNNSASQQTTVNPGTSEVIPPSGG